MENTLRNTGTLHKVPQKRTAVAAAAAPAGHADQDQDQDQAFHSRCMADTCLSLKELLQIRLLRRTNAAKRLRRPLPVQLPELIPTTWTQKP